MAIRGLIRTASVTWLALMLASLPTTAAEDSTLPAEARGRSVPTTTITVPDEDEQAAHVLDTAIPADLPEVSKSIKDLPPAVQRMREAIMNAALTGDVEHMRVPIQMGEFPPAMALHECEDIIDHLRAISGDEDGREILGIILEILEAGYAHMEPGTEREIYFWPYFAGLPFAALDLIQEVDLYQIITPHDRVEMESHTGQYTFFRISISRDGTWQYLLTGD